MRKNLNEPVRCWYPCKEENIERRLSALPDGKDQKALRGALEKLRSDCLYRELPSVTRSQVTRVRALARRFPNFKEVIHFIADCLHGSYATGAAPKLPPILLHGPPGLGKSVVGEDIAAVLRMSFQRTSLPEVSGAMVLVGNTDQWSNAQQGRIAEAIVSDMRAPMYFFDELDKCMQYIKFPVEPCLLSLLEPSTQRNFRDEYYGVEFDLAPAAFIFTANDISCISPPLLSRLKKFAIKNPAQADMPAIVTSVDERLRTQDPRFANGVLPLSPRFVKSFPVNSPRGVWQALESAYTSALRRASPGRKCRVTAGDIEEALSCEAEPPKRRIGF